MILIFYSMNLFIRATQSTYFEQILKDIHYYVSVTSRHSIARPERLESSLAEHRAILEAIIDGDKDEATERIQRHIRKNTDACKKILCNKKVGSTYFFVVE